MNPISWIAERVVTVIAQMIGGAVVNKAETEALKNHINTLSELEAEAKRHVKNISNGQPGKKKRGRPRKSETTTPTENQTQSPHSNNEASQ